MTKLEIFDQVVSIMLNDSSSKKDKQGANPETFRQQISEELSDDDFVFIVQNYLATFGILAHVAFYSPKTAVSPGFRLYVQEGKLNVIIANPDTNLQVGDVILALDGVPVADFYEANKTYFVSKTPERQYMDWVKFIRRTKSLTIERAGQDLEVVYQQADTIWPDPISWRQLDEETVYLKFGNFSDEADISKVYKEAGSAISQSKNLIIDVRDNAGGSDSLYWPLFNYTLAEGQTMKDLPKEDEAGQEFLYTDRNVDLRLAQFDKDLKSPTVSGESRKLLEGFSEELKKYRGQGYVTPDEDDDHDYYADFVGQANPKKVVVLSDVYCGSSGDNFVGTMKRMPKVTVMGRPTMGILDYSNCCIAQLDSYCLVFPTSRLLDIDRGILQADKGVEPDIFIPWTPEHLERDVDLEEALAFLHQK